MFRRLLHKTLFAVALAPTLLSACAGSNADYPSFAIPSADENAGRVSMRFPAVSVPTPADANAPEAAPVELDAQLAAIEARAGNAGQRFDASVGSARQSIAAANGAPTDSDEWSLAQVEYADLASYHSAGRLALAELDLIASRARLADAKSDDLATIAQLQDALASTLNEQSRILAAFNADLEK